MPAVFTARVLLLFFLLTVHGSAQLQLYCPVGETLVSNGVIEFSEISPISPVLVVTSEPLLSSWIDLANGFAGGIGTSQLPYEEAIIPLINKTLIQPSTRVHIPLDGSEFDVDSISRSISFSNFLEQFSGWLVPSVVVAACGLVLGLVMVLFCVVFFCCRCNGKCGAGVISMEKNKGANPCCSCLTVHLMFAISLILLVGILLALLTGTSSSAVDVHETFNDVIDDFIDYTTESIEQMFEILCHLGDGGIALLRELYGIPGALTTAVFNVFRTAISTSPNITNLELETTEMVVSNITQSAEALVDTFEELFTTVVDVIDITSFISLALNCLVNSNVRPLCVSAIYPLFNTGQLFYTAAQDINVDLSDFDPFVEALTTAISDAFRNVTEEGTQVVDEIAAELLNHVQSAINDTSDSLARLDTEFGPLRDQLIAIGNTLLDDSFSSMVRDVCPEVERLEAFLQIDLPQLNIGFGNTPSSVTIDSQPFDLTKDYLSNCLVNSVFEKYLLPYDTYRVLIVWVVCLLSGVCVLLVSCGCLCGCCNLLSYRRPSDRSTSSNCGANCLLLSAAYGLLFGAVLFVISGLVLFVSSNSLKICQSLNEPKYELLEKTIDDPQVRESIRAVVDSSVLDVDNIPLIAPLLRDCKENNTALYTALDLGTLFNLPGSSISEAIRTIVNITTVQARVDDFIEFAVETFDIDIAEVERILTNLFNHLASVQISTLNITGFAAEVENALTDIDLEPVIHQWQNISQQLRDLGETSSAEEVDSIITVYERVRDSFLPNITSQLVALLESLNQISLVQQELSDVTVTIIVEIVRYLENTGQPVLQDFINTALRGAVYRSFGYIDQYIDHVDSQFSNTVAGCQPLYGMLSKVHTSVCVRYLNSLNGFWWSLGFCAVLYIVLVLLAIVSSQFMSKRRLDPNAKDRETHQMKVVVI